ncbi:MAG TPA: PilZ domain-containing protein [Solimonas sp.]|nr:PilZ domain-containing protein [Solimonas sp.]
MDTTLALPETDSRTALIEDRRQIAALLGRVLHARALLTLSAGTSDAYTSLLLEVAPLRGCLLLDAPFPEMTLLPRMSLLVSGRLDGGHFSFRTEIESSSLASNGDLLQLRFPQRLHYRERRDSFRLPLPALAQLPVSQFGDEAGVFHGLLADISRAGAGTLVQKDHRAGLGSELSCLLRLPNLSLQTRAEVRSRREQAGRLRLGLKLLNLSAAQDALLSSEINTLQRTAMRWQRHA